MEQNVRKGKEVAKVGTYKGIPYRGVIQYFESINQAKKANGLNARVLQGYEQFPAHTLAELQEMEKGKV